MGTELMDPRRVDLSGLVSSNGQQLDRDALLFTASQLLKIINDDLGELHSRRRKVSHVADKCKADVTIIPQLRAELSDRAKQAICACPLCKELDPSAVDKRPELRAWIDSQFEDYTDDLNADHFFEMSNRSVHESLIEGEQMVARLRAGIHADLEGVRYSVLQEDIDAYKRWEEYYRYWFHYIASKKWYQSCQFPQDFIEKGWLSAKSAYAGLEAQYNKDRSDYNAYFSQRRTGRQKKVNDYFNLIQGSLEKILVIRQNAVIGTHLILEEINSMIQRRCNTREFILSAIG